MGHLSPMSDHFIYVISSDSHHVFMFRVNPGVMKVSLQLAQVLQALQRHVTAQSSAQGTGCTAA